MNHPSVSIHHGLMSTNYINRGSALPPVTVVLFIRFKCCSYPSSTVGGGWAGQMGHTLDLTSNETSVCILFVTKSDLCLMPCSDQTRRKYSLCVTRSSFDCRVSNSQNNNNHEPHQYGPKTQRSLCDLTTVNGSGARWESNTVMLSCKQPEFMLGQVCQPDDKQTTFQMLVPTNWVQID